MSYHPLEDLADEIGQVKKHLDNLDHVVRDQAILVSEALPVLHDQTALLDQLRTEVTTLTTSRNGGSSGGPAAVVPVCWIRLDAGQAKTEWERLAWWIEHVLVGRHFVGRGTLLDCWPLHPGAVEELSWLHLTWEHAFLPTSSPILMADWHTRSQPLALANIRAAITREADAQGRTHCEIGAHYGQKLQPHPGDQDKPGWELKENQIQAQLAHPRYWRPQLDQAVTADLATRPQPDTSTDHNSSN